MPPPTSTMKYDDFAAEIGRFLGFGRTSANWSAAMLEDIHASIQAGLRQFYAPPPLPLGAAQVMTSYRWRFLAPQATLTMTAGTATYALPNTFGGMNGGLSFSSGQNLNLIRGIAIVPIGRINDLLQYPNATDQKQPTMAALLPVAPVGPTPGPADIQRWNIQFFPPPDAAYEVSYTYHVVLPDLDTGEYPFGGDLHSETMLASMLAIAEERYTEPLSKGIMRERWHDRLKASIELDKQLRQPQNFGYNGDRSDEMERNVRGHWRDGFRVSYDGLFYPGGTPTP